MGVAKTQNMQGQAMRFKTRLVAKGFNQKFGVDVFETHSPVASMNSIRVVLGLDSWRMDT